MASILTAKMARERIFTLAELAKYNGENVTADTLIDALLATGVLCYSQGWNLNVSYGKE